MRATMRCPACNAVLIRLLTCSEPEGIRRDAACPECFRIYAVTKAGFIRLEDTDR